MDLQGTDQWMVLIVESMKLALMEFKKQEEKVQYGMTKDLIVMQCTALEIAISKLTGE